MWGKKFRFPTIIPIFVVKNHNYQVPKMKRIAALTMVRNDEFYLRKWVEYYGKELGRENLYIFFDGTDQRVPDFCEGANVRVCEKIVGSVARGDKGRINFLSEQAARLFESYDLVIGTDADEFLVVDPLLGKSLAEFLGDMKIKTSVSGLGVDVGQRLDCEEAIDASREFLSQRHYGRLSSRYTKANVIARPVRWGSGFHRVKGHNFHIAKNLYLFHFGYFDMGRIEARFADPSRRQEGWTKHIAKRSKTIRLCSSRKAYGWECAVRVARAVQTLFRPPYALNKPSMLEQVVIVRIPERFSKIV